MSARPLMKWAGGKSKLVQRILGVLPEQMRTYHEPFLGGGAVFFALPPERYERASLADVNPGLVEMYRAVRDYPREVLAHLNRLVSRYWQHPELQYAVIRSEYNGPGADHVLRAAMLLLLNKTCFNGLFRVNQQGQFNVPWGKYPSPAWVTEKEVDAASRRLNQYVRLQCQGFEASLQDAGPGDAVYLDPPYMPLSPTANFTAYSKEGFDKDAQVALAQLFRNLVRRGVRVVASNADTPEVREWYEGFEIQRIDVRRSIGASKSTRVKAGEVLIVG